MIATYRLQLHADFRFDDVRRILPYLRDLGVSHLYLSPITEARKGSTHGYDVVNHNAVRADLGGREAFTELADACDELGLRIILDFVPNHAGVGPRNEYWQDVLAFGPHSPNARVFDIEWEPLKPELKNKILLPFLGRTYGEVLDEGELRITYEDGRFYASYYENRFALSPATYGTLIEYILTALEREEGYFDLKQVAEAYESLLPDERGKADALRMRLALVLQDQAVDEMLAEMPPAAIHELLERQFWRLSYWKIAGSEINYRRFFDVNELVALRMEDDDVFWDAHRLLGELCTHPAVDGVRIDHVDGLTDPHRYLDMLTEVGPTRIWVEKILAQGETLPAEWPVAGTTGYEFMNDVVNLLVDADGREALDRTYRRYVGESHGFERIVLESKRLVMETSLVSELLRLSNELDRISEADYHTRDFTLVGLQDALREVVAAFGRYRTYLPYDPEGASEVVREAIYRAMTNNPATDPSVFEFIRRVIVGDVREDLKPLQQTWVRRFQQYTAPVTAKGVEDTAFYRYHRLAAVNEVGGEPDHTTFSPAVFHSHCRFRAMRYPETLLATATHDHKRGEDTRMRLVALTEIVSDWETTLEALDEIAGDYRSERGPSPDDIYLFYQVLVALWCDSSHENLTDRLWEYMLKASRESKRTTSWINPDEAYEAALETFVRGMADDTRISAALDPVATKAANIGFRNSLTQLVLKLTTPGVPDIYQGSELWDLSLVDPDNRRPVSYEERESLLKDFEHRSFDAEEMEIAVESRDVRLKAYVLWKLLGLRRDFDFAAASYRELQVTGEGAARWLVYMRETDDDALLVAVRLRFGDDSAQEAKIDLPDTLLDAKWKDVLWDQDHPAPDLPSLAHHGMNWYVLRKA